MAPKAGRRRAATMTRRSLVNVIFRALDYTTDGIAIGGLDGTIYYHNKAWLDIHALPENEDLRGRSIWDVERKEVAPIVDAARKALFKHGSYTYQFGTVRRDGVYHNVHVAANLVREVDPPVAVVILREVTDLVQAQEKLARRNKELGILNNMHGVIMSAKNRAAVISGVLKLLGGYVGASAMGMYLSDYAKARAVLVESAGVPRKLKESVMSVPIAEAAFSRMLRSSRTVVVEQDMPGYHGGPLDIRARVGVKRSVGVVFRTGGKEDYMAIFGLKRDEDVTPEIRRFFRAVGDQFGIAIERFELLDALRKREKELHELTMRLINSGEEEKRQCSRMLHDEVGQVLTGLRLEIDTLEKNLRAVNPCMRKSLEAMRRQIKFIADSTRTLSKSLHPAMLEDLGLVPTINWYIDKVVRSEALDVVLEEAGFDVEPPLPVSLALYRVAQECLTNVMRHARASRVIVKLAKGYPHVIMTVQDNGRGISLKKGKSKAQGLGLVSMKERVEYMGGTFQFTSSPGKGTKVRVTIPIEAKHVS